MKKQLLILFISFVILCQLFTACQKQEEEVLPVKEETPAKDTIKIKELGKFKFSYLRRDCNYLRIPAGKTDEGIARFDMDTINSSRTCVFSVVNTGEEPIFDITIASNIPAFKVSTQRIQSLPTDTSSTTATEIHIYVIHGEDVGTNGYTIDAPLLPKGINEGRITLTGKTIDGKDTIAVTGEFIVAVKALVRDFKILSGGTEVQLYDGNSALVEPAKSVQIQNTGNVGLSFRFLYIMRWISGPSYPPGTFKPEYVAHYSTEVKPDEVIDITSYIAFVGTKVIGSDTYEVVKSETYLAQTASEPVSNMPRHVNLISK